MANEEHLAILQQGVPTWNAWRAEQRNADPAFRPDLRRANLRGTDLSHADLTHGDLFEADLPGANLAAANLAAANLRGADLTYATLTEADLTRADLRGATLSDADLTLAAATLTAADLTRAYLGGADLTAASLGGADLTAANLTLANLRGAGLSRANLTYAFLTDADVTEAVLGETILADLDLSTTRGLDTVRHFFPSFLDIHTLYKSRGRIPDAFLRGIGAPDEIIDLAHRIAAGQSGYHSCFISYSTKDQPFADRLYADLQNAGVRCWFAPEDLPIGARTRDTVHTEIGQHDKLLIILSAASIASHWVEDEVERAFERERRGHRLVLFPIRIDDTVMTTTEAWAETIRIQRHIGDFRHWQDPTAYQHALTRLLRDLKTTDPPP